MLDHAVVDPSGSRGGHKAGGLAEDASAPAAQAAGLINHIERLLQAGRPAAVRPLLKALRRLDPAETDLGLYEARLLLAEGKAAAAVNVLDTAIAGADQTSVRAMVELYLLRGQIHVSLGHFVQAIDDTAAAVMLDPQAPVPKLRLGVLLVQLGRVDEAIACLSEAVATQKQPASMRGLAMAYERAGREAEATAVLAEAIGLWPKDKELRAASVMLALRHRRFAQAIEDARMARRDGTINAAIFQMMGDALAYLGRHTEAVAVYQDALKFAPDDVFIQECALLSEWAATATHGDRPEPTRLRVLFDLVAPGFDTHVLATAYRVPGLLRRSLQCQIAMGGLATGPVLDLGCGTGLVGLAIASFAGPITGFDVSPMMLATARAKKVYAALREGDGLALLQADPQCWPTILAGDALHYFGSLEAILAGVRARLAPGGRFIFSLAALLPADGDSGTLDWMLTRAGRHVHNQAYVESALAAAGLMVCSFEAETLLHEAETPIPGWIIVVQDAPVAAEVGL